MRLCVRAALAAFALLCAMHSSAYAQPAPPTLVPDPELALWEHIKMSAVMADYQDYLRRYPDGRFAATARQRLEGLRRAHTRRIIVDPLIPEPDPTQQHPNELSPSTPRPHLF
jgi:hypothetical protein